MSAMIMAVYATWAASLVRERPRVQISLAAPFFLFDFASHCPVTAAPALGKQRYKRAKEARKPAFACKIAELVYSDVLDRQKRSVLTAPLGRYKSNQANGRLKDLMDGGYAPIQTMTPCTIAWGIP